MISVIVPVYKVEQFLDRCISSIASQKYTDLEIILIDDGSPDSCGIICDKWAEKDSRIRVVHKTNGGLSDARNAGLKIAEGEYISFVDSDDWVSPDFFQQLYNTVQKENCDIVECEIIRTTGKEISNHIVETITECYKTEEALKLLIEDRIFRQHVWNKLYRREVIDGILFAKGKTHEDEFWTYQVFGKAKRIVKISAPVYFYFQRPGSIMGMKYSLQRLDALEAKVARQKYIDENYPQLSVVAKLNLFSSCIYSGQMTLKYLQGDEREESKKYIIHIKQNAMPLHEELKKIPLKRRIWMYMAKVSFWGTCKVKNILRHGF